MEKLVWRNVETMRRDLSRASATSRFESVWREAARRRRSSQNQRLSSRVECFSVAVTLSICDVWSEQRCFTEEMGPVHLPTLDLFVAAVDELRLAVALEAQGDVI